MRMIEPVSVAGLAAAAIAKGAGEVGKRVAQGLLPMSNNDKVNAEIQEQTQSVLLNVERGLDALPRMIQAALNEELNACMKPVIEGLEALRAARRLDEGSVAMVMTRFEEFVEQAKRSHGEAKRAALANALVRQFDEGEGPRGTRAVYWERLKELGDFEIDALVFLSAGHVLLRNDGHLLRGGRFDGSGVTEGASVSFESAAATAGMISAISRTTALRGILNERFDEKPDALILVTRNLTWRRIALSNEGTALVRFISAIRS